MAAIEGYFPLSVTPSSYRKREAARLKSERNIQKWIVLKCKESAKLRPLALLPPLLG